MVTSSLSGVVTEQGVTVRVNIIRLEIEPDWSLEVENEHGTSKVWDDLFATDDAAHAAFRQTVDEEGIRAFLDQAVVIPSDVSTGSIRRSFDPSVRKLHFCAVTP